MKIMKYACLIEMSEIEVVEYCLMEYASSVDPRRQVSSTECSPSFHGRWRDKWGVTQRVLPPSKQLASGSEK